MANKKPVFLILHCRAASYLVQNYEKYDGLLLQKVYFM